MTDYTKRCSLWFQTFSSLVHGEYLTYLNKYKMQTSNLFKNKTTTQKPAYPKACGSVFKQKKK